MLPSSDDEPGIMTTATASSHCECQARLFAELDGNCHVVRGWALPPQSRHPEPAPALSLGGAEGEIQIGWTCPYCTRNVLRIFSEAALLWWTEISQAR
jgi:hypothetical protein